MKKMLWGGRFKKGPAKETIEFNSGENIRLDQKLVPYDIIGSLAHLRMLYHREILSTSEYEEISKALRTIYRDWKEGIFVLDPRLEDVHMNVETAVTAITPAGKKMHTARSRNDQVLLDMRLYLRDQILSVVSLIEDLQDAFAELGAMDGPMVAYTHTRVAQPITSSFWCDAWVQSLGRDKERLLDAYKRVNRNPLGACAIAGTPWKIDREETARLLAFSSVQENELDAISSRGECEAEALSCLSLLMCKLSRLSEELIWLSEKGLLSISEEHTTGSSMMPNKQNPDILELIRGRSGRVYGNLNHCLVALKGLISGYHSDMQETKFALMCGFETSSSSLGAMTMVVRGLSFRSESILHELDRGFAQATEIADHLAMKGIPFREAHERSGMLVHYCEKAGKTLRNLTLKEGERLLGIKLTKEIWGTLRSTDRPRLKRKITVSRSEFVKDEKEKIARSFSEL